MKTKITFAAALVCGLVLTFTSSLLAQEPTAEQLKKLAAAGYESDPKILKEIATGGTPMGRWKEGLTFEGVAPMPWLKSAAKMIPFWPTTKSIFIPAAQVPPGLWLKGKPAADAPHASGRSPEKK